MNWTRNDSKHGEAYTNGKTSVQRISREGRPWFASRGLMLLAGKSRNVRFFGTPEAAMKAADKAKRQEFCG